MQSLNASVPDSVSLYTKKRTFNESKSDGLMPDPQSDCKKSVNIDKFVENVSSLQNSSGSDKVSLKESRYIK